MGAQDYGHAAPVGPHAQDNSRSAAVGCDGDFVSVAVFDDFYDIFLVSGVEDDIGGFLHHTASHVEVFIQRLSMAELDPAEIVGGHIVLAHHVAKSVDLIIGQGDLMVDLDLFVSAGLTFFKIVIGHAELLLEHFDPGLTWMLELVRVVFEYRTVRSLHRNVFSPVGLKCFRWCHDQLLVPGYSGKVRACLA